VANIRMASLLKNAKRGLRRSTSEMIQRATTSSEPWLRSGIAPALCYVDMFLVDYGVVRTFYNNRHQITQEAWRSAQPMPRHIGWFARRGVKTIINLRGDQTPGTRWLQERACARHGVRLVNLRLRSRAAPTKDELLAVRDVLATVDYPIAVHCKSGADRAGLMSVLIKHVRDGEPIAEARRQLSWRFGHIRQAETGVLGAVFDRYVEDNQKSPIDFWDWVARSYDPGEIENGFKANGWATRFVNGVLRRE
jgi:protein tyrosine phosphatase (PTP) superfamily phosphohydrolase (DUF442 family)